MIQKSILASLFILLSSLTLFSLNPVNAQATTIAPDATPILCTTFFILRMSTYIPVIILQVAIFIAKLAMDAITLVFYPKIQVLFKDITMDL